MENAAYLHRQTRYDVIVQLKTPLFADHVPATMALSVSIAPHSHLFVVCAAGIGSMAKHHVPARMVDYWVVTCSKAPPDPA